MNIFRIASITFSLNIFFSFSGDAATKAPKDAKAYIISPKNGDVVKSPVVVLFGLDGMGVAPAGVGAAMTGHHHLLVNLVKMPDMTKPLPVNKNIVHFGGGQTQTKVELPPGQHTLQLLLGDHMHVPHEPPILSEKITITVAP